MAKRHTKRIRKTTKVRKARTIKKRLRKTQRGGGSHLGPADLEGTIHRFAKYWWNTMQRQVWWSDNQDGYYFTNLKNSYMSTTHTHIYKIEDLDKEPNGRKKVFYSTKVKNVQTGSGTAEMPYNDIATWLSNLNKTLTG